MAGITEFVTGGDNTALVRSLWTQELLYQAREKIFWDRFSGPVGSGMPVIVNSDLTKTAGETVKIDFVSKASGAGVSGATALSTAEEEATFYQLGVTVDYKRNGFAVHKAHQQKTLHQLSEWGRNLSAGWIADKIDDDIFDKLDAVTTGRVYGGDATAKNSLATADVLTADLIAKVAATARKKLVKPVVIDGQPWYIMVVHPYAAYDLRADTDWLAAQQYAGPRNLSNPIFAGSLGAIHGVLLFENSRVEYGTNAGNPATVEYAICHLVGGEACGFAWAMQPNEIMEVTDYGARVGVGVEAMWGAAAAVFNSVYIGHVPVMVAAADPT